MAESVTWLNPTEHTFPLQNWRKYDQQSFKAAAVKAWQSISRQETLYLVISMGYRFQVICKEWTVIVSLSNYLLTCYNEYTDHT